ncbi:MAG: T9SS type A sorting domain-containing protein, partial [Flavobacteriales bacterium]|nr:T9SS type A sorting domain-containing protein [Flavobacteriales bacterium]
NGILAGTVNPSTIRIEHSEFGHNGFGDGFTHNLYINNVDSLIFRYNYSHHAIVGHELKSRARVNVIEYNRFSNENEGIASREIDLPNGGQAYLIGNVIQQGPQGENSNLVGFGMEGLNNPGPHELYAVNNTLVNEKTVGNFFQMPEAVYFKAFNNIIAGGGSMMSAWPTSIDTLANLRRTDITACGFNAPNSYDYRIDDGSPAHNLGIPAGVATNGYPLVALFEYVHPANGVERCQHALLDAGAFETCTTGIPNRKSVIMNLCPNPVMEQLSIHLPSDVTLGDVEILDAEGRLICRRPSSVCLRSTFDVSGLRPGFFTVRAHTSRGLFTGSFVKQ